MKMYNKINVFGFYSIKVCTWFLDMCVYHVQLFAALWTRAHQTPLSMDSPGKNTGAVLLHGGEPCPPPGVLPD